MRKSIRSTLQELADDEAENFFRIQRDSAAYWASFEIDSSTWARVNEAIPGNAERSGDIPSYEDRLFEAMYRRSIAGLWMAESAREVARLLEDNPERADLDTPPQPERGEQ